MVYTDVSASNAPSQSNFVFSYEYVEDWPSYNKAHRNEKPEFLRLLRELCAIIPQPDLPPKRGRPSIPIRDMIYSMALKVYTTVSGRRFMGDLDVASEKGYISRVPSYNAIFDSFEKPDLTFVVKRLIEVSAMPLKSVEVAFAGDSSGFSTSRFDRWFDHKWGKERSKRQWLKAHIMTGVKTNVVTAIEVTPSTVHDSPMLPPLMDTTATGFNVQEVSLDKAYLSEFNISYIMGKGATPYIPFKSNTTGQGSREWEALYHYFMMKRDVFMSYYHKRSNVETTFSMIKGKFRDSVRAKTDAGMVNEIMLKVLCHNICCLISAMYEMGVNPNFRVECPDARIIGA